MRAISNLHYNFILSTIYILVRPKRGKQPQERLQELLSVPIFTKMPKDLLCKVVAIEGDITGRVIYSIFGVIFITVHNSQTYDECQTQSE